MQVADGVGGKAGDQARIARTSRYSASTLVLQSGAVLCSAHNDSNRDAHSAWFCLSSRENVTRVGPKEFGAPERP